MFEYEEAVQEFARGLQDFIEQYELPENWFKVPDHVAIKCSDNFDYEYVVQELLSDARQASEINLDNRRLAALWLTAAQPVGELGSIQWVEIMEPRPEKVGEDVVGLEHMEFYYPNFEEIQTVLNDRGIPFTHQANVGHAWINIVLNSGGQELKLNNRLLENIVTQELEEGIAHIL